MTITLFHGWPGILLPLFAGFGVLRAVVDGATWLMLTIRHRCRRRAGLATAAVKPDPRDLLRATVRGTSIPGLESAALDRARSLYGADARVAVERIENVATSHMGPGLFVATAYVRHLPAPAPTGLEPGAQETSTA